MNGRGLGGVVGLLREDLVVDGEEGVGVQEGVFKSYFKGCRVRVGSYVFIGVP